MRRVFFGAVVLSLGCGSFAEGFSDAGIGSATGDTTGGETTGTMEPTSPGTSNGSSSPGTTSATTGDSGSSGEPAETGLTSNGSEDTGAPLGPHDGTYTGPISTTFNMENLGVFVCDGTVEFVVDEDAVPPVTGTAACQVLIPQLMAAAVDMSADFTGTLDAPNGAGELTYVIVVLDLSDSTPWTGSFAGDVFTGSFSGLTSLAGFSTTFDGNWTAQR